MSCSKPLPPFIFDLLCYLNRDQLEQFSCVCRSLKNFIDRYFHSKPYRIFDKLEIRGGLYALIHKDVRWHPNRNDYSVQQFLARQKCGIDEYKLHQYHFTYYSFSDMTPYLGPTVRINWTTIDVAGDSIYGPEHITEMESIVYLWRDGKIHIWNCGNDGAKDFLSIFNSPTILQCRKLYMSNVHFSFKDYKILYSVKLIDTHNDAKEDLDPSYWTEFLERPGIKPIVILQFVRHKNTENLLNRLSKSFSSSVTPSAFKIVFCFPEKSLTDFRETNTTSGEILELKKGPPINCESIYAEYFDKDVCYTLERSSA